MQIRKIYSYNTENLNKVCTACQLISVIQEVTKKHNKKVERPWHRRAACLNWA